MDTVKLSTDTLSIQPSEFLQRLRSVDSLNAPLILDVRRQAAFEASDIMMAGAQRCAPEQLAEFAQREPSREVVVYCVYGHHVSRDAAAALHALGWNARYLAGGIMGGEEGVDNTADIAVWRSVQLPLQNK